MTHPKVLAMSREICAEQNKADPAFARYIKAGECDDISEMRVTIAAIEQTTRLAADYVGEWCDADSSFDHLPEPEGSTNE